MSLDTGDGPGPQLQWFVAMATIAYQAAIEFINMHGMSAVSSGGEVVTHTCGHGLCAFSVQALDERFSVKYVLSYIYLTL